MLLNLNSILLTLVTVIVRHVEPGRIEEKNMFRHKKKSYLYYQATNRAFSNVPTSCTSMALHGSVLPVWLLLLGRTSTS